MADTRLTFRNLILTDDATKLNKYITDQIQLNEKQTFAFLNRQNTWKSLLVEDLDGINPALLYAAQNNKWNVVNALVDKILEYNEIYQNNTDKTNDNFAGNEALILLTGSKRYSCSIPKHDLARKLIDAGAVCRPMSRGLLIQKSALHIAIDDDPIDENMLTVLCKQKGVLTFTDHCGEFKLIPLVYAASLRDWDAVRWLKSKTACNIDTYSKTLLFYYALIDNNIEQLKEYWDDNTLLKAFLPMFTSMWLFKAVEINNQEVLKRFLKQGFNAYLKMLNNSNQTVLEVACQEGKTECIDALIEHCQMKTKNGFKNNSDSKHWHLTQSLKYLIKDNRYYYTQTFLEYGVKFEKDGAVELLTAVQNADIKMIRLLLEKYHANAKVADQLSHAVARGDIDIVRLLLEHGAQVNSPDGTSSPALLCAIKNNNKEIIKLLLQYNAVCNKCGKDGNEALFLAINKEIPDPEIITWLLDCGADPNALDDHGNNMTQVASILKKQTCVYTIETWKSEYIQNRIKFLQQLQSELQTQKFHMKETPAHFWNPSIAYPETESKGIEQLKEKIKEFNANMPSNMTKIDELFNSIHSLINKECERKDYHPDSIAWLNEKKRCADIIVVGHHLAHEAKLNFSGNPEMVILTSSFSSDSSSTSSAVSTSTAISKQPQNNQSFLTRRGLFGVDTSKLSPKQIKLYARYRDEVLTQDATNLKPFYMSEEEINTWHELNENESLKFKLN